MINFTETQKATDLIWLKHCEQYKIYLDWKLLSNIKMTALEIEISHMTAEILSKKDGVILRILNNFDPINWIGNNEAFVSRDL